jgi:hypothetical protein
MIKLIWLNLVKFDEIKNLKKKKNTILIIFLKILVRIHQINIKLNP